MRRSRDPRGPGDRGRTAIAAMLAAALLAASACSGDDAGNGDASPTPAGGASSPEPSEADRATPDPELLARALSVQAAQQALSGGGQGTFTVDLEKGQRDGVLPRIDGAYDFSVPAGSFAAVTEETDRTVRLRYRTRQARAWSQVLYPGSPLAPDCWYQIALPQGDLAMPAQVSALLYLEPDPADPTGEQERALAQLVDVLNAVGLTRLANILGADAAVARVPVEVALAGGADDADKARFDAWTVDGADLLSVLDQVRLGRGAAAEVALLRDAVASARWRIDLQEGDAPRIAAPAPDRVLLAGGTCS